MSLLRKFTDGDKLDDQELEDLYQELCQITDEVPLMSDCTTPQYLLKSAAYRYMSEIKSIQNARKKE